MVDPGEAEVGERQAPHPGHRVVPMENSIEGTVRETLDTLIFESDLLVQREVVMAISLNLLAPPGVGLADVRRVVSYPVALGQCRSFFRRQLPSFEEVPATS